MMVFIFSSGMTRMELDSDFKEAVAVKEEVGDSLVEEEEDEHWQLPLAKRSRISSTLQLPCNLEVNALPILASNYNPLDEPSPLGLRLRKSPSLLDLIQMRLSEENVSKLSTQVKEDASVSATSTEKLKASNFPALVLRIGAWEYSSKHEGDLVAKCYFAKHKLVWEVLDGGLKNKIEIQWSDIMDIKAHCPDNGLATLDVVLNTEPLFFRETNPQPRKHTLWQAASDFTGGQASIHRRHFLQCAHGLLGKHLEKIMQCDSRLNFLSQQPEIFLESPYFERKVEGLNDSKCRDFNIRSVEDSILYGLPDALSPHISRLPTYYSCEASSPGSVIGGSLEVEKAGRFFTATNNDYDELVKNKDDLQDITHYLLSESEIPSSSDEQSIMSRVNSLLCLLHKDPNNGRMGSESTEGDLLNLPRIASLPQFLFNVAGRSS